MSLHVFVRPFHYRFCETADRVESQRLNNSTTETFFHVLDLFSIQLKLFHVANNVVLHFARMAMLGYLSRKSETINIFDGNRASSCGL